MIIYACAPGHAPERIPDAPGADALFEWVVERGYRAAWVMTDEGVEADRPAPCCYGSIVE